MTERKRSKGWTYYVVTNDWPVGVGTVSQSLSRDARYDALKTFGSVFAGAMEDLAGSGVVPPAVD